MAKSSGLQDFSAFHVFQEVSAVSAEAGAAEGKGQVERGGSFYLQ